MSRTKAFDWHRRLKKVRTSVKSNEHSGRSSARRNAKTVEVCRLVKTYRKLIMIVWRDGHFRWATSTQCCWRVGSHVCSTTSHPRSTCIERKWNSWQEGYEFVSRKANVLKTYKSRITTHLEYRTQACAPISRHGNWIIRLRLEGIQSDKNKFKK